MNPDQWKSVMWVSGGFLLGVLFTLLVVGLIYEATPAQEAANISDPILEVNYAAVPLKEYDVSGLPFNTSKIMEEQVAVASQHFTDVDFTGYEVEFFESDPTYDNESDGTYGNSKIGIIIGKDMDEDMFRLAFTHEHVHYILYQLGLQSWGAHEAFAEAYVYHVLPEIETKYLASKSGVYVAFLEPIMSANRESCLEKVFDRNDLDGMFTALEGECKIKFDAPREGEIGVVSVS